jgi:hypothetical protein
VAKKKLRDRIPPKGGFYYNNELYLSPAYLILPIGSRNLLHMLINELRWKKVKGSKAKAYTNNCEVSFTEVDFKELFGSASQTYINARNKLIEVGFIRQTHRGGMCRGDRSKYKILCTHDFRKNEMRWLNYPERNWKDEIPRSRRQLIGVGTQFKKGKSSRKC